MAAPYPNFTSGIIPLCVASCFPRLSPGFSPEVWTGTVCRMEPTPSYIHHLRTEAAKHRSRARAAEDLTAWLAERAIIVIDTVKVDPEAG
jgi:hypothetical protein